MTRVRSLLLVAGLALAAPATASAATLDATRTCYFNGSNARLTGTGFAPDSSITFTVNGRTLRTSITSDSAGDVFVNYIPPRTDTQRRLRIRATDEDGTTAAETIYVSRQRRVTADPDTAENVSTWRAVLRLYGFGRGGRAFVHYLNPNGKHKKTVRLGRLRGPCGKLETEKRRMMPFDDPQFGTWRLQFDKRRRFDRDTENRRVIPVRVYRG